MYDKLLLIILYCTFIFKQRNPRLQAGKELRYIMSRLKYTNEKNFTKKLDEWFKINEDFIDELTVNPVTGECFYKHQKLSVAYRSLRRNLPYLFTYKKYKSLDIPSTTNTLDGGTFCNEKEVKCSLWNE
jgi:hypothetical protein